jgi:hypothetical protein
MWIRIAARGENISRIDRFQVRAHKRCSSVKSLLAFVIALMFGHHTHQARSAMPPKKNGDR